MADVLLLQDHPDSDELEPEPRFTRCDCTCKLGIETGSRGEMVTDFLARIQQAQGLARAAKLAYETSERAARRLHLAAERAHVHLLRGICQLPDEVADAIEPPFTAFEMCMLALPSLKAKPIRARMQ